MNRKSLLMILSLLLLIGCASVGGLGNTTQMLPSSYGVSVTIDELEQGFAKHDVFYSGPVFNPSALLFRPPDTGFTLKLAADWKPVADRTKLKALIKKIETIDPKLWVLTTPGTDGSKSLLAYIYTPAYASLRKAEDPDAFYLRAVPEQFNSIYYEYDRRPFDQTPEW
jgi:hypothetical protein